MFKQQAREHASSICIVIPYFGQWPVWIDYFLQSCRYNPSVDWLIYTDCTQTISCPDNVKLEYISFQEYCQLVSDMLDIPFAPNSAYKLCDIKPCLGLIHQRVLKSYDFWAFGDLDVIYGNLRAYLTEEKLSRYDLIGTHARRVSGHLCVIRNSTEMRYAFMKAKDWKQQLVNQQHMAFDEKGFSKLFKRHKNSPKWYQKLMVLTDPWLGIGYFEEMFTTPNAKIKWLDGSNEFPEVWFWSEGVVSNDKTPEMSFPYLHFFSWKKNWTINNIAPYGLGADISFKQFKVNQAGIHWQLNED